MPVSLSPIVASLLEAHNAHDTGALVDCFTEDATLRHDGHAYHGLSAIGAWFDDRCRRCHPVIEVTAVSKIDDELILTGTVSGSFPDSPASLRFVVATENGKIVALRITLPVRGAAMVRAATDEPMESMRSAMAEP